MPRFEVKQSSKLQLASYSGLALIGQCCQAAQVEAVIDPKLPVSQGMRTADIVKSVVGLSSLGKSDFEAIEPFREDRFFKEALALSKVPSGRLDTNDVILHLAAFAYSCLRLLGQVGLTGEIAPIRHPARRRRIRTVPQEIMYRAANAAVFVMLQNRLMAAVSSG